MRSGPQPAPCRFESVIQRWLPLSLSSSLCRSHGTTPLSRYHAERGTESGSAQSSWQSREAGVCERGGQRPAPHAASRSRAWPPVTWLHGAQLPGCSSVGKQGRSRFWCHSPLLPGATKLSKHLDNTGQKHHTTCTQQFFCVCLVSNTN